MSVMFAHTSPPYSDSVRDDALFHYTSADGLIGILQNKEIWSTAYYILNDYSELSAGEGLLTPIFDGATDEMIQNGSPLVELFANRGIDIRNYARTFAQQVLSFTFSKICPYLTCFCRPMSEEDFAHGLLSQWRSYGIGGGYALQFSRKKLLSAIDEAKKSHDLGYHLQNVIYDAENPLKAEVLSHAPAFLQAYNAFLKDIGPDLASGHARNPILDLLGGPLESLLDYLIQTKNLHFSEERECRLSVIDTISAKRLLSTNYFNRNGSIVPYKKTPPSFPVVDCIEWIVVGPNSRMGARYKAVTQMVQTGSLKIGVRPSHIPFGRD
jgi:hypothetical protein